MKLASAILTMTAAISILPACRAVSAAIVASAAYPVADMPPGHWAAASVDKVIALGVMTATGSRFDGSRKVTRVELANTLARFAMALEKGAWQPSPASPVRTKQPPETSWSGTAVTRYELAALLDRVGKNVGQGLPKPGGKTFGASEALPPADISKVPGSSAAYDSLAYLVKNRMVWGNSILLKPGDAPVTGKDVVMAVAMTISGLADRLTDEPQNRPDLGEPPGHKHDK